MGRLSHLFDEKTSLLRHNRDESTSKNVIKFYDAYLTRRNASLLRGTDARTYTPLIIIITLKRVCPGQGIKDPRGTITHRVMYLLDRVRDLMNHSIESFRLEFVAGHVNESTRILNADIRLDFSSLIAKSVI